jgi:hypothetical protein
MPPWALSCSKRTIYLLSIFFTETTYDESANITLEDGANKLSAKGKTALQYLDVPY